MCGSHNIPVIPAESSGLSETHHLILRGGGDIVNGENMGLSFSGLLKMSVGDAGISIGFRSRLVAWLTRFWLRLCEANGINLGITVSQTDGVMWSAKWDEIVKVIRSPNSVVLWKDDRSGIRFIQLRPPRLDTIEDLIIRHGLKPDYVRRTFWWHRTRPVL